MKMNIIRKLSLTFIAAIFSIFAITVQAQAANDYTDIKFTNTTGLTVDISGVSWSGSYWPQFSTSTVVDDANVTGDLRTGFDYGHSGFTFYTTINAPGDARNGEKCYFTFNVKNSTGNLSLVAASRRTVGAKCRIDVQTSGYRNTVHFGAHD
ncbi:MAG: hypothetical protein JKY45_00695 [Emcibacter sp.]|nr:hypothetical protein [Emcibacter sp.]